nr:xylulose kinase-1 [Tanacetum cinerariifolium]
MTLTFADTHNMIAYLTKSDASEGFNQIIDFLNGSSIKYALTVNPNIYVSCIKQFWTSVAVKKVNDVMRLQALVDKKKVIITEATIRDALHLDDAEGIECLPMRRSSLSRKFNFSKYIFDSLVRNIDNSTKFYMYPRFLQLMIRKQVGDLSTHTTKYSSPALTQKVFANMRMVGKGCFRVETPLFKGMIVAQEVADEGDAEVNVDEVLAVGVAAEGVVSDADDEVPTAVEEPFIPSPTTPTPPPPSSQDQPLTSQDTRISMDLLQNLMDPCITFTRRVEHLEPDKIAQALEITKLKSRDLELLKKEKGELETKLTGFQTASKDLDNLLESQRLDKNKEGLGYSAVPPLPAQIYSPPKKDMSWTGLLEFADDTVTDYSRPAPTVESSSDDAQNRNPSVTAIEASPSTISPKLFIKFVKANDSPIKSKTDKVETAKKPPVKPYRPPISPTRPNTNAATRLNVNNARPQTTQDLMVILIQRVKRLERELKARTPHTKIHKVGRGRSRCNIKFRGGLLGIKCSKSFPLLVKKIPLKTLSVKKEKEGVDSKLPGFLIASKDLDHLIESQRSDKNKEGLGYSVVPPPPAQIYSSPMKDLS